MMDTRLIGCNYPPASQQLHTSEITTFSFYIQGAKKLIMNIKLHVKSKDIILNFRILQGFTLCHQRFKNASC